MSEKTFAELYEEARQHDEYWIAQAVQELNEEICRLMEERSVTRSELARRLGVSPAYVTKILRGNTNFTLASMVRLARALGADLKVGLVARSVEATQNDVSARGKTRAGSRRRPRARRARSGSSAALRAEP